MRQRFDQFPQLYRPKQNCETSKMKQLVQLTQLLKTKLESVRTNKFNSNNYSCPILVKISRQLHIYADYPCETSLLNPTGRTATDGKDGHWVQVGMKDDMVSSGRVSFVGVSYSSLRRPIEIAPSTRSFIYLLTGIDLYQQLPGMNQCLLQIK